MRSNFDRLNVFGNIIPKNNDISPLLDIEQQYNIQLSEGFKIFYEYYGDNNKIKNGYVHLYSMNELKVKDGKLIFGELFKMPPEFIVSIDNLIVDTAEKNDYYKLTQNSTVLLPEETFNHKRSVTLDLYMLFAVAYEIVMSMPIKLKYDIKSLDLSGTSKNKANFEKFITNISSDFSALNIYLFQKNILVIYDKGKLTFGLKNQEELNEVRKYINLYL
ncbi:hypothetical protein AN640_06750 [Candidatus Epulonipiscium fishelsonii]|uniref:Uncharacterized protein n=1 Tax=Candidatus Epulonipiscium fishelsonii TaxID=77094 RepID=A0ACC8XHD6_9FIRM|nr:hypothetical protein AN640_06750 [Epulopiscium sp. SCG-D08WGA-EpuloA1]OON90375.1 MAG: hypothetical protein ATN32_04080 [Epulopiscium sp. AS2M-Bin002]